MAPQPGIRAAPPAGDSIGQCAMGRACRSAYYLRRISRADRPGAPARTVTHSRVPLPELDRCAATYREEYGGNEYGGLPVGGSHIAADESQAADLPVAATWLVFPCGSRLPGHQPHVVKVLRRYTMATR